MSAQSLLEQLLKSGLGSLQGVADSARSTARRDDFGKYASGAAVGGVLGLLLGSRRGRSMGGKALKYGSVAAIGALAWKAWQDYQAQQAQAQAAQQAAGSGAGLQPMPAAAPGAGPGAGGFAALPAPQQEQASRAMLQAMIAAAKSDGHMDDRERELVQAEMQRLDGDTELQQWVQAELQRPVDPAAVAAAASGPEMAASLYLASLLVVDDTTVMERAYLDELARQLRLAPELKASLESRAAVGT